MTCSIQQSDAPLTITVFHRQQIERDISGLLAKYGLEANPDIMDFLCKTIVHAHQFGLYPKGHKVRTLTPTLDAAVRCAVIYADCLRQTDADPYTVAKIRNELVCLLCEPGIALTLTHTNYDAYRAVDRLSVGNIGPRSLAKLIRSLIEVKGASLKTKSGRPWTLHTSLMRAGVIAFDRCGHSCEHRCKDGCKGKGAAHRFVRELIQLAAAGKSAVLAHLVFEDQPLMDAISKFRQERLSR